MGAERIGVVGAGLMGAEIALVHAMAGHDVILTDAEAGRLSAGMDRLTSVFDRPCAKPSSSPPPAPPSARPIGVPSTTPRPRRWRPCHPRTRSPPRAGIDPAEVDDVVMGAPLQQGATGNIARQARCAAGLPASVAGMSVDRQCASA
jgi:hypothetical protein